MEDCILSGTGLPDIRFSSDLEDFDRLIAGYSSVFVVADTIVCELYREIFVPLRSFPVFRIESCESAKSLSGVESILRFLLENGADRDSVVVAVGGGIVSDMAGFAASVYRRGIRYVNVPTTLLAQVDASIGGKTGVNFDSYKNMVGTVHQPEFTFVCGRFLETLPDGELRSGFAELVKSALIADRGLYERIVTQVRHYSSLVSADAVSLREILSLACTVKASIAGRDPLEKGERRLLNFGHTFGHAIESLYMRRGQDISHGDAVSAGMAIAVRISVETGRLDRETGRHILSDMGNMGLPVSVDADIMELCPYAAKDKKVSGDSVNFVLLEGIGSAVYEKIRMEKLEEICAMFR